MILRLGLALAWGRSPEQRARRWLLATFSAVATMLVLGSLTVLAVTAVVEHRHQDRSLRLSASPGASDLFYELDTDYWRGHRIRIAWIAPAGDQRPVLPPGVVRLPRPGQAVVSPALDELARRHAELARIYPDRAVIGSEGVAAATELVAYLRPPAGRRIGGESQARHIEDGVWVGEGPVFRVSGFGGPRLLALDYDPVPPRQLVGLVFGAGIVPSLILVAAALGFATHVRDRRAQVLRSWGVGPSRLAGLAAIEAWAVTVPACGVTTATWTLLAPHVSHVPLLGVRVLPGDLSLPAGVSVAALLATLTLTAAVAAVHALRGGATGARPTSSRTSVSRWSLAPLGASVVLFVLAGWTGLGGQTTFGAALLLAVVGAPCALPWAFHRSGLRLARSPRLPTMMIGERMAFDPRRTAGQFLAVATLATLGLVLAYQFTSIERLREHGRSILPPPVEGVGVVWRDVRAGDLAAFDAALDVGSVFGIEALEPDGEHAHGRDEHPHILLLGAQCARLETLVTARPCAGARLTPEAGRELSSTLARTLGEPVAGVRLVPHGQVQRSGRLVVLSADRSLTDLDAATLQASRSVLPAAYVESEILARDLEPAPLQRWIARVLSLAVLVLAGASLLLCVDPRRGTGSPVPTLVRLGAGPRAVLDYQRTAFLTGFAVAIGVGGAVGLVAWQQLNAVVGGWIDLDTLAWLMLGAAVMAVLGTAITTMRGVRGLGEEGISHCRTPSLPRVDA